MKENDESVRWFNTEFYPKNKTSSAQHYEKGVLPRLRQKEIFLFTPWGPRYNMKKDSVIEKADREVETLSFLAKIFGEISKNMTDRKFSWLFLGADLYGTRINRLPENSVREYFTSLSVWLGKIIPTASFRFWSEFDQGAESFREEARKNLANYLSSSVIERAKATAQAMGRGSDAQEYLVERVAEALLIEERFRPIKISCVDPNKDAQVDVDLPRLYFIPKALLAPWMG